MPLNPRKTKAAVSENISTLRHENYPEKQAIAIVLQKAGKSKYDKKSKRSRMKRSAKRS